MTMSPANWAALIVSIFTIVAFIAGSIKWLTKHYFDEIRSEIRPNSGTSLKDQVTRLESRMIEADYVRQEMDKKIDKLFDTLLSHIERNSK